MGKQITDFNVSSQLSEDRVETVRRKRVCVPILLTFGHIHKSMIAKKCKTVSKIKWERGLKLGHREDKRSFDHSGCLLDSDGTFKRVYLKGRSISRDMNRIKGASRIGEVPGDVYSRKSPSWPEGARGGGDEWLSQAQVTAEAEEGYP